MELDCRGFEFDPAQLSKASALVCSLNKYIKPLRSFGLFRICQILSMFVPAVLVRPMQRGAEQKKRKKSMGFEHSHQLFFRPMERGAELSR